MRQNLLDSQGKKNPIQAQNLKMTRANLHNPTAPLLICTHEKIGSLKK